MLAMEEFSPGTPGPDTQPSAFDGGFAVYMVREDDEWPEDGALTVVAAGSTVFQTLYAATGLIYVRRAQSVSLWAGWKTVDTTSV